MTNHWRDIQHADVIMINGANPAEAHPVGFQWFLKAKLDPRRGVGRGGGAQMIHIDPRFTRTSAVSAVSARIRTGTDVAFFGGLINYVLQKNLIHHEYVRNYTNASFIVKDGFERAQKEIVAATPGPTHASAGVALAKRDMQLEHPRSVFQLMRKHYSRYTPQMVASITGIPEDQFLEIAKIVGETGR